GGGLLKAVFLAWSGSRPVGFLELSVRPYAEGCDGPAPFVEGWFVAEAERGRGVGRALVAAAEAWALERGFTDLASDTQLWNTASQAAHAALGFVEEERLVSYRKPLRPGG
ncbi:MAG TPA: GNAT family N-acetyltransferase, partial [Deinococcales bacterium]|nr:GNAT family N-acetyltransferase [Deinococcales bacterium]